MVSATIHIEGGGDGKDLKIQCRRGFSRLLTKCGYKGKMPTLVACGSRNETFSKFRAKLRDSTHEAFIAMLIDSEEPVSDITKPWNHLSQRDGWQLPTGATDDQVMMMTTSMETWIAADHMALAQVFGNRLSTNHLPSLRWLENRTRQDVLSALQRATDSCPQKYTKGKVSFEVVEQLDPETLSQYLPSFARTRQILDAKL